jgi:hypothetical protein
MRSARGPGARGTGRQRLERAPVGELVAVLPAQQALHEGQLDRAGDQRAGGDLGVVVVDSAIVAPSRRIASLRMSRAELALGEVEEQVPAGAVDLEVAGDARVTPRQPGGAGVALQVVEDVGEIVSASTWLQ